MVTKLELPKVSSSSTALVPASLVFEPLMSSASVYSLQLFDWQSTARWDAMRTQWSSRAANMPFLDRTRTLQICILTAGYIQLPATFGTLMMCSHEHQTLVWPSMLACLPRLWAEACSLLEFHGRPRKVVDFLSSFFLVLRIRMLTLRQHLTFWR